MRLFNIMSLWKMIELLADNLLASISNVSLFGSKIRQVLESFDPNEPNVLVEEPQHLYLLQASLHMIADQAKKIDMPVTLAAVWRCQQFYEEFQLSGSGIVAKRRAFESLAD